jgi:glutaredoxin
VKVRLFSKPGCLLCEDAERLLARYPVDVEIVDISADPELLATYGERIPVLEVGGQAYGAPLSGAAIERALRSRA